MNKEENIKLAVEIFEKTLRQTYEKNEFYGIGLHSLTNFFTGKINIQRLKNGNLKLSGEIGKDCLNEKCVGLPRKFEDWNIFPIVVTLFSKNIGVERDLK